MHSTDTQEQQHEIYVAQTRARRSFAYIISNDTTRADLALLARQESAIVTTYRAQTTSQTH